MKSLLNITSYLTPKPDLTWTNYYWLCIKKSDSFSSRRIGDGWDQGVRKSRVTFLQEVRQSTPAGWKWHGGLSSRTNFMCFVLWLEGCVSSKSLSPMENRLSHDDNHVSFVVILAELVFYPSGNFLKKHRGYSYMCTHACKVANSISISMPKILMWWFLDWRGHRKRVWTYSYIHIFGCKTY